MPRSRRSASVPLPMIGTTRSVSELRAEARSEAIRADVDATPPVTMETTARPLSTGAGAACRMGTGTARTGELSPSTCAAAACRRDEREPLAWRPPPCRCQAWRWPPACLPAERLPDVAFAALPLASEAASLKLIAESGAKARMRAIRLRRRPVAVQRSSSNPSQFAQFDFLGPRFFGTKGQAAKWDGFMARRWKLSANGLRPRLISPELQGISGASGASYGRGLANNRNGRGR